MSVNDGYTASSLPCSQQIVTRAIDQDQSTAFHAFVIGVDGDEIRLHPSAASHTLDIKGESVLANQLAVAVPAMHPASATTTAAWPGFLACLFRSPRTSPHRRLFQRASHRICRQPRAAHCRSRSSCLMNRSTYLLEHRSTCTMSFHLGTRVSVLLSSHAVAPARHSACSMRGPAFARHLAWLQCSWHLCLGIAVCVPLTLHGVAFVRHSAFCSLAASQQRVQPLCTMKADKRVPAMRTSSYRTSLRYRLRRS